MLRESREKLLGFQDPFATLNFDASNNTHQSSFCFLSNVTLREREISLEGSLVSLGRVGSHL